MIEISDRARELVWSAEQDCKDVFRRVDAVEMANQQRVLEAFWNLQRILCPVVRAGTRCIEGVTCDTLVNRDKQVSGRRVHNHRPIVGRGSSRRIF